MQNKLSNEFNRYLLKVGLVRYSGWLKFERTDTGHSHIEFGQNGEFYYVITERGSEFERRVTHKLDDVLYWVFSDITFTGAREFELKHRESKKDSRRLIFLEQLRLMSILSESWKVRLEYEIKEILIMHPFDDEAYASVS